MNSENTSTRKAKGAFKWMFIILFILASMISSVSYSYAAAVTKNNNDSETSADSRIQSFDVENDKSYKITFVKKDQEDGKPLSGGRFKLYKETQDVTKFEHVIWLYDPENNTSANDLNGENIVYKASFSFIDSAPVKVENDIIALKKQYGNNLVIVTGGDRNFGADYAKAIIAGKNPGHWGSTKLPLDGIGIKIPVYSFSGAGSKDDELIKNVREKYLTADEYMSLSMTDDNLLGTASADSDGKIIFDNLKYSGTVALQEVEAPVGYNKTSKLTCAEIGDGASTGEIPVYNRKYNLKFIKKSSASGQVLSGGKYQLYNAAGDRIGSPQAANAEGVLTFEGLTFGKYHLEELEAPSGYQINEKGWDATVSENMTAAELTHDIYDDRYAKLRFQKVDKTTQKIPSSLLLSSFKFRLLNEKKEVVADNLTLDQNGEFQVNNVPAGKYHLEETKAPEGYKINKTGWDVVADSKNPETPVVKLENNRLYNLQIKKTDSAGTKLVNGGKFQLYDKDNNKIGNEKSLTEGTLYYSLLSEGTYHLTEIEAPSGTIKNDKGWDITVSAANADGELVVEQITNEHNKEKTKSIVIQKSDGSSYDALVGGRFMWHNTNAKEDNTTITFDKSFIGSGTSYSSDNKGQITIRNVSDGWYYLAEKEAPVGYKKNDVGWLVKVADKNFYICDANNTDVSKMKKYDVTEGEEDNTEAKAGNIGIITNKPEVQFRIAKTDESGNPVKGVKFDFIADSEGEDDFTFTTDSKGYANISQLKDGVSYTMRESSTPVPYIKSSSEWTVLYNKAKNSLTITDKNGKQTVYDITKEDSLKTYPIKNAKLPDFVKKDALTGNAISGAEFALLTENQYASYKANGELPEEESKDQTYSVTVNTDPYTRYEYDETTETGRDVFVSGEYTGAGEYQKGETAKITYKAYFGHSIQKIYLDGKDVTDKYPNGITFDKISQNHIIRLVFDDAVEPENTYESDADDVQNYTETYIHGRSGTDGTIKFFNNSDTGEKDARIDEGTYYLIETKAAEGYDAKNFSAKKVIVSLNQDNETEIHVSDTDGTEMVKIGGKYIVKNAKDGNVSLLKTDSSGASLEGAVFTLEGVSASGDRISMNASSSQTYKSDSGIIDDTPASEKENDKGTVDKTTGTVNFEHVPEGYNYIITEKVAPSGKLNGNGEIDTKSYAVDENMIYFAQVITNDNTKTRNPVTQTAITLNKGTYFYDTKGNPVSKNSNNQLVVKNDNSVSLGVMKSNANGNVALNGVTFKLEGTSSSGTKISSEKETGADASKAGFVRFDNLEDGTYYLTEEKTPEGYEKNTGKYKVTVKGSDVTMTDPNGNAVDGTDYFAIGVKTFDISNNELSEFGINKKGKNGTALKDAEFTLSGTSDGGEKVNKRVTTDANGHADFTNLPKGTYTLTETKVPASYGKGCLEWTVVVDPFHTVISGTDKEPTTNDYTKEDGINVETKGGVTITEKYSGKAIVGKMRSQNSKTVKADTYYLKSGTDYLEDNEQYVSMNTSYELTRGKNSVTPEYVTYTVTDDSGKILNDQNSGVSSNGTKINLSGLNLKKGNTYYVTASFYEDASRSEMKSVSIMLRYTDSKEELTQKKPSDFTIENTPMTVKLKIVKKDSDTKKPLRGVSFEVWSEKRGTDGATLLKSGNTDVNGEIDFGEIMDNSVYVYETSTPSGYTPIPDNTCWNVAALRDASTCISTAAKYTGVIRTDYNDNYTSACNEKNGDVSGVLTIYNEPDGFFLPITGGKGIITILLAALVCILGAVEYRIIKKKREGKTEA